MHFPLSRATPAALSFGALRLTLSLAGKAQACSTSSMAASTSDLISRSRLAIAQSREAIRRSRLLIAEVRAKTEAFARLKKQFALNGGK